MGLDSVLEVPSPLLEKECDWSRSLSPPTTAQSSVIKYKKYGVIVTVWDALHPYDTFGARMVVSLDAEYQSDEVSKINNVLSYQVTAYGQSGRMAQLIFHIPDAHVGHRLSLSEIIDQTRRALRIKTPDLRFVSKQPGAIRLISHFSTAEWSTLRDRKSLASVLKIVRKSPITLGATVLPLKLSNRTVKCGFELTDTTLIAPAQFRALARIGDVLNFAKVKLPAGAIENMAELRRADPRLFDHYAITDTRIALAYYIEMQRIAREILNLRKLGPTLGSLATNKYLATIGDLAYLKYFGLQRIKQDRKTVTVPIPQRDQIESFVAAAFMGGLNMAYPRETSGCLILDIDFTSCYPSAGATLPAIDWEEISAAASGGGAEVLTGSDSTCTPISISYVEFEFPKTCTRPTIPVGAGPRGLIYPLSGVGYVTHFELEAARAKGARIQIIREVMFPILRRANGAPELAFAEFFQQMIAERNKYPKNSLENLMYKEVANSAYGKLAQGVKRRNTRSFDSRTTLQPSPITCPPYACAITGLVRAALIGLMDAAEDVGGVILAATTDGAMIAFPDLPYAPGADIDDVPGLRDAVMSKPAIAALSQGRVNSGCDPSPVEVKHVGDNAIVMKTRGYILRAGTSVQHIAKCGHQMAGRDHDTQAEQLEAYHNSTHIDTWHMTTLSSAQKIWDGKAADVVRNTEDRRVNVDFDFKVIPDGRGGFRPPADLEEFISWRETVDNIRRKPKPGKNGREKPAYRATIERVRMARSGIRIRGGEEETLRRMFLYAIAQDVAGLFPGDESGAPITQSELARRTGVSVTDIKNARRRSFRQPPRSEIAMHVLLELLQDAHEKPVPYAPDMDILFE